MMHLIYNDVLILRTMLHYELCVIMHVAVVMLNKTILIRSCYLYSTSSSQLLLRGAPETARTLCWSSTPKCHRHLQVKDLFKVPTWRPEWESNPRPFGRKETNLPMSHHAPHILCVSILYVYQCSDVAVTGKLNLKAPCSRQWSLTSAPPGMGEQTPTLTDLYIRNSVVTPN